MAHSCIVIPNSSCFLIFKTYQEYTLCFSNSSFPEHVSRLHSIPGQQSTNPESCVGYVSSFTFNNYREKFRGDVYALLVELLTKLRSNLEDGAESEAQTAAEIHKRDVLVHFCNHSNGGGRAEAFISHSTCFSCLFEPPEHALPCGHILCTPCLRAYGHPRGKTIIELDGCPYESVNRPSRHGFWKVYLKPDAAGIRILTLDG